MANAQVDGQYSDSEAGRRSICFVTTNRGIVPYLLGEDPHYLGGIELQMSLTGRGLVERGWEVTFVVADEGQDRTMDRNGLRLVKSFPHSNERQVGLFWHRWRRLAEAVRYANAQVYILQGASWQASLIAQHCEATGARFVFWVASDTDPMCLVRGVSRARWWEKGLAHRGMRRADAIAVQTERQRALVRRHLGQGAHLVRNIWPYDIRQRELPPIPTVLWVANVRPVKRPEMLLEIARRLPGVSFVAVGGPVAKQEQYYERVMQEAGRVPNLTLTGFVPFPEADRRFKEATVFLNTSAVEGFPNTYLQAWARGVPVVGSFDPDEVICSEGLGVHISTVEEAVAAIRRLCANSDGELSAVATRATSYMEQNHRPEVVLGQLERLVESLPEVT